MGKKRARYFVFAWNGRWRVEIYIDKEYLIDKAVFNTKGEAETWGRRRVEEALQEVRE